jgi:hypothetical protein
MGGASFELTLELWALSLREAKDNTKRLIR